MSRKRTIAIAGIALLAGLPLVERATRTVEVLPATVVDVISLVPDAGPDQWSITFTLAAGAEHSLDPLIVRPTLQSGDKFCVRIHKRSWAAPKFQKAADKTC
ncbi:MAG: hypothetical protein V7695_06880 [Sulfitobacter sp.]|jgi:hypothetical protein